MRGVATAVVLTLALVGCAGTADDDEVEPESTQEAAPTSSDAGDGADDGASGDADGDAGAATEEPVASVTISGTDDLTWEDTGPSAPAGLLEVTLACGPDVSHSLLIEGANDDRPLAGCLAGASSTKLVTLEAGSYDFACTLPGHGDMRGTLTVG